MGLFGQFQISIGVADPPQEFVQDLGACAGDFFTGMSVGFHPGKEKDERNPAARVVLDFGSNLVERGHQADGEGNHFSLAGGWIDAVFWRRCHEILAANERANGVYGAGLINKERARNTLVVVFDGQALMGFVIRVPEFLSGSNEALQDATGSK